MLDHPALLRQGSSNLHRPGPPPGGDGQP